MGAAEQSGSQDRVEFRLVVPGNDPFLDEVDEYCARLEVMPSRAQLIKHLMRRGMKASKSGR